MKPLPSQAPSSLGAFLVETEVCRPRAQSARLQSSSPSRSPPGAPKVSAGGAQAAPAALPGRLLDDGAAQRVLIAPQPAALLAHAAHPGGAAGDLADPEHQAPPGPPRAARAARGALGVAAGAAAGPPGQGAEPEPGAAGRGADVAALRAREEVQERRFSQQTSWEVGFSFRLQAGGRGLFHDLVELIGVTWAGPPSLSPAPRRMGCSSKTGGSCAGTTRPAGSSAPGGCRAGGAVSWISHDTRPLRAPSETLFARKGAISRRNLTFFSSLYRTVPILV